MMNIYEYLTVFATFLIILAPTAMVAVAMGVTFGFIKLPFGFIKLPFGFIEMPFGFIGMTFGFIGMTFEFASFASGSVEMTFDAVGGVLRMGGDGLGLVRSTRGSPRRHS